MVFSAALGCNGVMVGDEEKVCSEDTKGESQGLCGLQMQGRLRRKEWHPIGE
jgi:hypothetical protein